MPRGTSSAARCSTKWEAGASHICDASRKFWPAIRIDDPLQIGRNLYIALDDFSIRFNHSCEANAGIRRECELFALVDIPRGTEITFDYSMTVVPSHYSWFWKMSCNCGAPTCRKRIGDLSSVPPTKLCQYVEAGALQDYMLNYLQSSTK